MELGSLGWSDYVVGSFMIEVGRIGYFVFRIFKNQVQKYQFFSVGLELDVSKFNLVVCQ